ncbi:MAG: S8 family serine peptidase [Candidatus Thorarchaeota archaeon]|nr:S8 family serine peptidase [Candidatus Thorarchaeota archaeon]
MKKIVICTLLVFLLTLSTGSSDVRSPSVLNDTMPREQDSQKITLDYLTDEYEANIPIVARIEREIDSDTIAFMDQAGIAFSLDSVEKSSIGNHYLLEGPAEGFEKCLEHRIISDWSIQTSPEHLHAARDVSMPEINATTAWNQLDSLDRNVTGEDILIADLDSGVDWTHPDLWSADGGTFDWKDSGPANAAFDNGTDYVDLDGDDNPDTGEELYAIDLDRDGSYNCSTDWLWADNVTQDGIPQIGEPYFVVNDTNGDDQLQLGEPLTLLATPKTKYIVEEDGFDNLQVWMRGKNLTQSTHEDTDGHGTAVSGILLGGQVGFRKYVGAAPSAELMMLKVLGSGGTSLTVEKALMYARNQGADVILTEFGSWTYHYLDGSSPAAGLIDDLVDDGVPVISPSGNLGGKEKHANATVAPDTPYDIDFHIPTPADDPYLGGDIEDVYITLLSVNDTDFSTCNFSLVIDFTSWSGPASHTIYLHPGAGKENWNAEQSVSFGGSTLVVESYISVSSRSTKMLAIHIFTSGGGSLPTTTEGGPYHQLNITAPASTTFHCYISDDKTSWTGGAIWTSDEFDYYHITWPSTADSAVSVASYHTRDLLGGTIGDIADFSSRGPRIDEVQKQGVAAPGGYDIISDYSNASTWYGWYNNYGSLPFDDRFASYQLFSGTSASGPHVAGCAALMLQISPTLGSQVGGYIKSTARNDSFTGSVPNPTWGYGKLDVLSAVLSIDVEAPVIHSFERNPLSVEYYQNVTVEANVTDNSDFFSVFLKYNATGWGENKTVLMAEQPSGNYTMEIGPFNYSQSVYYSIFANDTGGNGNQSSWTMFTIGDTVKPNMVNPWRNATSPGANHDVAVSIDILEPAGAAGVDTVLLNYSKNDWSNFTVLTMQRTQDTYSAVIPGQPLDTSVEYFFWANDTEGNTNYTSIYNYTTISPESNPPTIDTPDRTPVTPNSQENVTVTVIVSDDTEVDTVILSYYDGENWHNSTMTKEDSTYIGVIPELPAGTEVIYRIYASDILGNWEVSSDYSYTVESETTTTTSPTGTTTTTTTSTTTTGLTPDYLRLAIMSSLVVLLVVVWVAYQRHRSK